MTRGRDKFDKYSQLIYILYKIVNTLPRKIKNKLFLSTRNINGVSGLVIRYILLKSLCKTCGVNVSVHPGSYLLNIADLSIGKNVSIHPMCYIDASGGIEIGDEVSIAHSTTVLSSEHIYQDINVPIKNQGIEYKKTTIESDVWIGAGCRILAGGIIREGSIVAAGAVVKGEIQSNSIVGGIPAKLIKKRGI